MREAGAAAQTMPACSTSASYWVGTVPAFNPAAAAGVEPVPEPRTTTTITGSARTMAAAAANGPALLIGGPLPLLPTYSPPTSTTCAGPLQSATISARYVRKDF